MSVDHELSDLFAKFAAIMEIKGENVFKAIAFSKVSRLLKDMTFDIKQAVLDEKVGNIEGIGAGSRRIIEQYIKEGRSVDFDEAAASVPPGLLPMLDIPGLGPKTIALLWKERGVTNIEELVKAIDENKLAGLKGIGEKKIQSIKQGISMRAQAAQRRGIGDALPIAEALVERLRAIPLVKHAQIAGSLRRGRETIGDVDLICSTSDPDAGPNISAAFVAFPEVTHINGQGATKASVITAGGLQVDLRIVPEENFGAALLYFTGSKDHGVKIRGLALSKKMTLNEWGLYKLDDHESAEKKTGQAPKLEPLASKSESDVYRNLGMAFVEPEMREDRGEVELAVKDALPRLITIADYHGDLHTHTTASDGRNSIEEMAEAAAKLGYLFLAVTDHSKSQVIANGLTADRLLKHVKEIHRVSERMKGSITLLAGCEVDILVDGRLDFEDAILAELDFVVASPHVSLKQDTAKATDRILRAIENRYVNVIGHPTGRLINQREGLPLNFEPIFKAAAATGTALEINAGYPRLDLNDINARAAIGAGVMLSINSDAHAIQGLKEIGMGIQVARRAWATAGNVLNCSTLAALREFISQKRKH
jgi:DNA polymerase (family 10)